MTLSVIIASHSDADLPNTLDSLRATAGDAVEALVVDDASLHPVSTDKAKVIRTKHRIGVGPARTLGAIHAKGDYLLFVDAHCRFTPGWLEAALARIVGRERTLHCGVCLGLGLVEKDRRLKGQNLALNMDINNPNAVYHGAQWNFFGHDRNKPSLTQVFECIWANPPAADDAQISAVMGAAYFWPRKWFLELNPLAHLRSWAGDEQSMSLKAWLSGGEVRLLSTVRIGHRFRHERERPPFNRRMTDDVYNKLFLMHTILPLDKAAILQTKFKRDGTLMTALRRLADDWQHVEIERARNEQMFTRSFDSLLAQFNIPFPNK